MKPSKSRPGISEASKIKTTSENPKFSKMSRNGSTKSVSRLRPPVPRPCNLKPFPKLAEPKPSAKSSTKLQKPECRSKVQVKLDAIENVLKKAREQLALIEKEKNQAIEELNEAKRCSNEINEKLRVATVAKKKIEESLVIEKLRADELEQASIDAARKAEEYQKELKVIQHRHSQDASALLAGTRELQMVKFELDSATNAKNIALKEVEDAKKIAELNGEKVVILSREVINLKSLLDSNLDNLNKETAETMDKLNAENIALKLEIERAKSSEEKLLMLETLVEQLRLDVTDVKKVDSDASKQANESTNEAEANRSEKSTIESLAIIRKKLEEDATSLQNAETEITDLKEKIGSLKIEVAKYKIDLDETNRNLNLSQQEELNLEKTIKLLQSELEKLKGKLWVNDKAASTDIERLLEDKSKLIHELESSRDEGEKVKKAMEGLASALHEISTIARENEERALAKQGKIEEAEAQIKQLNSDVRNTEEIYQVMLDEARYEIVCLKKTIERFETVSSNLGIEWDTKELHFVNNIKISEDELASLKVETTKGFNTHKLAEKEAKTETLHLNERLLAKENELQAITQDNGELLIRETSSLQKIKDTSSSLEVATAKIIVEKPKLSESEKKYVLLPNTLEEINGGEKLAERLNSKAHSSKHGKENQGRIDEEDSMDIISKGLASEAILDNAAESKMAGGNSERVIGTVMSTDYTATSPIRNQQQKKKFFHSRFGNLLKKGIHIGHK